MPQPIPPPLLPHFEALGIDSIVGYKLWCHKRGLSTALDKSPEARKVELEIRRQEQVPEDPETGPDHNPRRAALFARIFAGERQDAPLTDVATRIKRIYDRMADEAGSRDAFGRLVLHVERYAALLNPAPAVDQLAQTPDNNFISGLEQLARQHRHWIRPLEAWRPDRQHHKMPSRLLQIQFDHLANYLVAKYNVPPCMHGAWFMGNTEEARRQQGWLLHVAGGQNIRTAGVPMRITKKMAHIFTDESRHRRWGGTNIMNLRDAQILALGGDWHFIWGIHGTVLTQSLENEDFWETVVHFFVNNPMLEPSYAEPIIDYIRHQKFLPQRIAQPDGTTLEMPPPQPNFSMKGRSAAKLIGLVDAWHEELGGLEDVPLETWSSSGINEFTHAEKDKESGMPLTWSVHELRTSQQLAVEGRLMHHCVASYTRQCAAGEASIWSIRVVEENADAEEEVRPRHILTVALNPKKRTVTQYRGKFNLKPFDRKHLAKLRHAGSGYLKHLRESARILRLWMDQEGLRHE